MEEIPQCPSGPSTVPMLLRILYIHSHHLDTPGEWKLIFFMECKINVLAACIRMNLHVRRKPHVKDSYTRVGTRFLDVTMTKEQDIGFALGLGWAKP